MGFCYGFAMLEDPWQVSAISGDTYAALKAEQSSKAFQVIKSASPLLPTLPKLHIGNAKIDIFDAEAGLGDGGLSVMRHSAKKIAQAMSQTMGSNVGALLLNQAMLLLK